MVPRNEQGGEGLLFQPVQGIALRRRLAELGQARIPHPSEVAADDHEVVLDGEVRIVSHGFADMFWRIRKERFQNVQ